MGEEGGIGALESTSVSNRDIDPPGEPFSQPAEKENAVPQGSKEVVGSAVTETAGGSETPASNDHSPESGKQHEGHPYRSRIEEDEKSEDEEGQVSEERPKTKKSTKRKKRRRSRSISSSSSESSSSSSGSSSSGSRGRRKRRRNRKRRGDSEGEENNEEQHVESISRVTENETIRPVDAAALPTEKKRELQIAAATGVYLPPAKRRLLEQQQNAQREGSTKSALAIGKESSGSSVTVQRQTWEEQKRVIHGTINRLNASTIKPLIHDLFDKVNLIRLRGVLAKSLLQAVTATAAKYAPVYAALTAVINSKLPEVGELIVHRAVLQFQRHYRRKEKAQVISIALFLGHLFHQGVVHELLLLQILTVLLDGNPTDDSVEVAVQLLTTTGYMLLEVSAAAVRAVLERFRALLHEGHLNQRVQYKMEQLLALRKAGFQNHPAAVYPPIPPELDLIESDDQITFENIMLDDESLQKQDHLDVFRPVDPQEFTEQEQVWSQIRAEILGLNEGSGSDEGDSETDDGDDDAEETGDGGGQPAEETDLAVVAATDAKGTVKVQDLSDSDLVHLRRTIYLTIMSSATFEECTHKLAKIDIPEGREEELINMLIECCSQERTFLRYYGLIGARFCLLSERWKNAFIESFVKQYQTIHRLETNKLRNVAKLFAHLLHTDSLPWSVLSIIHLNEDETTSSSRIFLKIIVQEMAEAMGIGRLKERFGQEATGDVNQLQVVSESTEWCKGMFPRDNVRNTRYAINFFTSIGLGPLTDGMREYLKNAPKLIMAQAQQNALVQKSKDDASESDSSSVLSSSSSSSDSTSLSSTSSSSSTSSYSSSSSRTDSYASESSSSTPSRRRRSRGRRRRSPSISSSKSSGSSSVSESSRSRSPTPPRRRHRTHRQSSAPREERKSSRRGAASDIGSLSPKPRGRAGEKSRTPSPSREHSPASKESDGRKAERSRKTRIERRSSDEKSPDIIPRRKVRRSSRSASPEPIRSRKYHRSKGWDSDESGSRSPSVDVKDSRGRDRQERKARKR